MATYFACACHDRGVAFSHLFNRHCSNFFRSDASTFRPFRHRNINTWVYVVAIAGVWILTAMIVIPLRLIGLYLNVQQQWQLLYFVYLLRSYCCLCLIVICFLHLHCFKILGGACPPSDGAANRQRKVTATLFIMTIVSLLLWLPYVVYTFVSFFVLDRVSISGHIYA